MFAMQQCYHVTLTTNSKSKNEWTDTIGIFVSHKRDSNLKHSSPFKIKTLFSFSTGREKGDICRL